MKVRKILSSILVIALVLSTMGISSFAKEADDVALLAGYGTYVKDLQSAFTPEVNPDGKQVLMVKNWTGDVDINYPGLYTSFYLNGYTMDGQLKLTDTSKLTLYGIEAGNDEAGTDSVITASGFNGDYTIYQSSGANLDISGKVTIKATETDGTAIYAEDGKVIIASEDVVVYGNIEAVNPAIIKITAGTYMGSFEAELPTNLEITGGKFAIDPSEFLPSGYTAELGADGMYSIIKPPASLADLTVEDGKYVLSDADDVVIFREVMSKESIPADAQFVLANDIDMTGITLAAAGNDTNRFYGSFDGNNYKISNITINGGNDTYVAFFGNTSGATIKNLTLENITVTGGEYTAGLVGRSRSTTIENCKVTGDIAITGTSHVGGILGGGVINLTDCDVIGNDGSSITGTWDVGGIAGLVSAGSTAVDSNNVSNITINAPDGYVGGVAGRVLANAAGNNISLSYNTLEDTSIVSGDTYGGSALLVGVTATGGKGIVTYTDNSAAESSIVVNGVESNVLYAGVEGDTNINIPVAKIGDTYYYSLKEAVSNATANTTIYLLSNVEEGSIKLPATITNLTIDGQGIAVVKNTVINASDGGSVNYQGLTIKNTTFDNSRFVLGGQRAGDVIYKDIVFDGNTFTNIVNTSSLAAVHMNIASEDNEYIENFKFINNTIDGVTGSSNSGVLIKNAKGDIIFDNNTITNVAFNAIQCINSKNDINLVITNNTLSSNRTNAVNIYKVPAVTFENNTVSVPEGYSEIANFNVVAENGVKEYSSLAAAIADGGEITLVADAALTEAIEFKKETVIDLNGYTLNMTAEPNTAGFYPELRKCSYYINEDVTFKNGTINVSNETTRADHGLFFVERNDSLTFDDVDLVSEGFNAYSLIQAYAKVNYINGTTVNASDASGVFMYSEESLATVTINDSEITLDNLGGGISSSGIKLNTDNATITMTDIAGGAIVHASGTINDTEISVENAQYGIRNSIGGLNVTGDSKVTVTGSTVYDLELKGTSTLTVADTATVILDTTNIEGTSAVTGNVVKRADAIEVDFELATSDETSLTYDIVLKGINAETINRLNSADLTFALTQETGKNIYEIIDVANDNITLNPVYNVEDGSIIDGRYEFHFETKTGVENDTAAEIVIAQVKFTGYGKFDFGVAGAATNEVHATTLSDNIVDTYIPNGDTSTIVDGELVIDNDITGAEIIVPKRNLTIRVSFPNNIVARPYAYQDMKVTVAGPENYERVIYLGNGDAVEKDGDCENLKTEGDVVYYEETISGELTLNSPYTVTVEGAGYRTVKYTVNMTENKTLNFWNNVKDNAQAVEVSESNVEKYAQTVTFLAGDIVKDNEINVYDLSAVVSYFGEIDLDEDNKPTYAKYDLNRDGKIDSKDVAYVLVSWGN